MNDGTNIIWATYFKRAVYRSSVVLPRLARSQVLLSAFNINILLEHNEFSIQAVSPLRMSSFIIEGSFHTLSTSRIAFLNIFRILSTLVFALGLPTSFEFPFEIERSKFSSTFALLRDAVIDKVVSMPKVYNIPV